jgi:hypothetical protein
MINYKPEIIKKQYVQDVVIIRGHAFGRRGPIYSNAHVINGKPNCEVACLALIEKMNGKTKAVMVLGSVRTTKGSITFQESAQQFAEAFKEAGCVVPPVRRSVPLAVAHTFRLRPR